MASSDPHAATTRSTTYAYTADERTIHFDDLVRDGEMVEVDGRRMVVRYDPLAPDWYLEEESACNQ